MDIGNYVGEGVIESIDATEAPVEEVKIAVDETVEDAQPVAV